MSKNNRSGFTHTVLRFYIGVRLLLCSLTTAEPYREQMLPNVDKMDNPVWHAATSSIYMVSKIPCQFYRLSLATNMTTQVKIENIQNLDFVVPVRGNKRLFFAGADTFMSTFTWDGNSSAPVQLSANVKIVPPKDAGVILTGKTDSSGKLWIGTKNGLVCSVESDGTVAQHLSGVGFPNGLAFGLDETAFYYTDSDRKVIVRHDYDSVHSVIAPSGRVVFDFAANGVSGAPNGITVDSKGYIWVACSGNDIVVQIDPGSGATLSNIDIPDNWLTSVVFGGHNLDMMFVTTAGLYNVSLPGTLFEVTGTQTTGLPSSSFNFANNRS